SSVAGTEPARPGSPACSGLWPVAGSFADRPSGSPGRNSNPAFNRCGQQTSRGRGAARRLRAGANPGQPGKVEDRRVEQVAWVRVAQRAKDLLPPAGGARLPRVEHRLDLLALQLVLAAAQVAGND